MTLTPPGCFPQVRATHARFNRSIVEGHGCVMPESNPLNLLQICSWSANRRDPITMGCASMSGHTASSRESVAHSFSSPTALWRNIFLLVLTALIKVFFTAWSFGMMAGYFI